jgi:hypothetical protein
MLLPEDEFSVLIASGATVAMERAAAVLTLPRSISALVALTRSWPAPSLTGFRGPKCHFSFSTEDSYGSL